MTDEEILKIAYSEEHIAIGGNLIGIEIIKFARAIEAKAKAEEREACVVACENEKKRWHGNGKGIDFNLCIAVIRARGN